ncbi:Uncharacterised protein [Acinetobacter baumannii]|nr:Uncharacterised protein [Acinetobacter baumannii]
MQNFQATNRLKKQNLHQYFRLLRRKHQLHVLQMTRVSVVV